MSKFSYYWYILAISTCSVSGNRLTPMGQIIYVFKRFKHSYKRLNGWIHPELIVPFMCTPILMLLSYTLCVQLVRSIHMRNLSQSYYDIAAFIYDLYSWMCIYVFSISKYFLCNKASWEHSVTEWFTLYEYIWNEKYIYIYVCIHGAFWP